MDRRVLLGGAMKASVGLMLGGRLRGEEPVVVLKPGAGGPVMLPGNFTGLGFEMSSVAVPGLLRRSNAAYVRMVKGLGRDGVIRVGGIVADYTRYQAAGEARSEAKDTVVTRESLEGFGGFLREVGWRAIWSVNFAQGPVEEAVVEARAVAEVLGERLLAIEIGNEVENYGRGERAFRGAGWSYEGYRAEFEVWRRAIAAAVPGMRFAAPDTASSVEWVERMARDAKGEVQLLTTHYYRGGQKQGTVEQLMTPDVKLGVELERLRVASRESGVPWRMCETNSFFGGGRPGVSDTLVGALWVLDFMLLLATRGCAGVNIETGVNQLGFLSSYSPIRSEGGVTRAGAPYYGMLAFGVARAGCAEIREMEVGAAGVTGYALGAGGRVRTVVVVNRGSEEVEVSVAGLGMERVGVMRMVAPGLSSVAGVTLGGLGVDAEGRWAGRVQEWVGGGRVRVGKGSAVVVRGG